MSFYAVEELLNEIRTGMKYNGQREPGMRYIFSLRMIIITSVVNSHMCLLMLIMLALGW